MSSFGLGFDGFGIWVASEVAVVLTAGLLAQAVALGETEAVLGW